MYAHAQKGLFPLFKRRAHKTRIRPSLTREVERHDANYIWSISVPILQALNIQDGLVGIRYHADTR